jgi:hypothetical protein
MKKLMLILCLLLIGLSCKSQTKKAYKAMANQLLSYDKAGNFYFKDRTDTISRSKELIEDYSDYVTCVDCDSVYLINHVYSKSYRVIYKTESIIYKISKDNCISLYHGIKLILYKTKQPESALGDDIKKQYFKCKQELKD